MGKLIGSVGLAPGSDEGTDLTTKGDLHGYSSSNTRIPIGSDDQVLTADSAQALGLKWADSGGVTITSQTTSYTDGQTTTSSSLVDITGSSTTLPSRTGGKALITQYTTSEANGQRVLASGLYYDSADKACGSTASVASGNPVCITVSAIDNLDGGTVVGRWRVSGGTATLKNSGTTKSECTYFELS